jgi:1-hydroxycarotenoid 3,4-desaturase
MTSAAQKIVVIGAGLGGLCAAIRLAAAGMQVTLVEQQAYPGGKMRSLASAAGPIDAGPTVLTLRTVFDDIFALAGERLDTHLTLTAEPLLARHWWPDGSRLDLFCDPDQSAAAIAAFAGARAEAEFRRFNAETAQLYAAFKAPMIEARRPNLAGIAVNALRSPAIWPALYPGRSLSDYVQSRFTDPRLRQLFGRYATYVGGAPEQSPAVLALIWQAEARGVWRVEGGMHQLAEALAALATRLGVTLRYGISALRLLRKAGRVTEVALSDGRSVKCDAVVFNGDPAALLAGLLGNGAQLALPPSAAHPRSLSAWVWSFAARPAPFDLAHHNVFFGSDPRREFGPIAQGRMPEEPTLYVCAQDRSRAGPVPTGVERFEIIMNAPAKPTFSPNEAHECRIKTFPQLAKFGLTFDPPPHEKALTTPQGFAALFPGSQGAIYGRSPQGLMASFQRPQARTRLPGLYLAGGGAHPGAGVPMAALSGKHAAETITKDLISVSSWQQMVMRGGTSMVSRLMRRVP